jgi:membrane fusion protein
LLEKQIEVQKNRIAMYESKALAYEELLKKHYMSEIEYQRRQDEYLNAKLTLHNYEKELGQAKGGMDYAIRAPSEGMVSTLLAMVGDHVVTDTLLASIVPKGSQLDAILYVPTSKAGFVKLGQKVLIKYYAYPYQRFGLYNATITRIDKSVTNPQETAGKPLPFKMDEVFYRVTAKLHKQTVNVYGKPYPLTAGMLFEGVILGEKRRIWQWIMDPIYSLRGAL